MKLGRNSIWLVLLLVFLLFPLWSIPVGNFLTPRGGFDPELKNRKADQHRFSLNSVKILQNEAGADTAHIRAKKAFTDQNPEILLLEGVDADLFGNNGEKTRIVSQKGEYDTKSGSLVLIDDVVVHKIADDQFLYTDKLIYQSDSREVHTPGRVRMLAKDVEIDGGRLNYDIATGTYVLDKRVTCVFNRFAAP